MATQLLVELMQQLRAEVADLGQIRAEVADLGQIRAEVGDLRGIV